MMSAGAKPKFAVRSHVCAEMRDVCAWVHVTPWPSNSKLTVTLERFCLNWVLIWLIAFWNASELEPEFHEMTLSVTGPPPLLAGGAAAAGALVAAGADGAVADWPHAARTTAPAPRLKVPSKRLRLKVIANSSRCAHPPHPPNACTSVQLCTISPPRL